MRALGIRLAVIVGSLLLTPAIAIGQALTATWDSNPLTDLVLTYEVCISTTALSCNIQRATVPVTQTAYSFAPVPGQLTRVAVRAVSALGAGAFSPELVVSIPAIAQIANRTNAANTAITPLTVSVTDPDNSPRTFSHTGLPFGLTLNSSTGVISGTPTSTGTYNVVIHVNDGLVTASTSFVWTIQSGSSDATAPTVAVTSHTPGQTLTTPTITLGGTASDAGSGDSGISSVRVNGSLATGGTASGNATATWTRSLTLAPGANALSVIATDGAGNASTAQITINLQVPDTSAPTLSITSHISGQSVGASSITLSGTATDSGTGGSGITRVTINGTQATGGTATGSNTTAWSGSVALVDGSNVITVVATDGAGNSRQVPITINRDASSPSLTISSHVSGQIVTSSTVTVSGSATDNGSGGSGITSVTVNGQTASGGTASGNNTAFWSRSVTLSTGTNTISVVATDGAGSSRTLSITVTRTSLSSGLSAVAVTPNTGSGTTQTFTAQFGDTSGSSDISTVYVRFSTSPTGSANTCMVRYERSARRLSLRDDAGNWQTGVAPGSAVTQQNSQCSLSLAGSAGTSGGQMVTVTIAMTFKNAYAGPKNIYLYAQSNGGVITDWQHRGTWSVPATGLSIGAVTPNTGSGAAQLFSAQFLDSLGASDLAYVYLKFAVQASGSTNTCMVRYDRAAATLSLRDDAGVWQPGQPFSLGGTQQNGQCAVNFSASSAAISGQTLTLNVALSFKPGYAGAKNIYGYAQTNLGAVTDWQQVGTWTILAASLSADAVTPNSGSGNFGTFSAQYTDQYGISDLSYVYLKFDTEPDGAAGTCMVRYEHATGRIALRDDAGTWMTGRTFAQGGTQQNSQCEISVSGSSASVNGQTLTLTVPFTFTPSYSGSKSIYSYASNVIGGFTDWQLRGTWTIP